MTADCRLISIDVETTGLDCRSGRPLEIGAVALDSGLSEIGTFHALFPPFSLWGDFLESLNPTARETHTKSGLLDDLKAGRSTRGIPVSEVDRNLSQFVVSHYRHTQLRLISSSPDFIVGWLDSWFPNSARRLDNRTLDVAVLSWLSDERPSLGAPKPKEQHRALEDAREAVEMLRWWRDEVAPKSRASALVDS